MRKNAGPADLQRWSEEVAHDPGAPSFVPLADAYRRQGNREAAVRVCLRGLERNPTNIEAHTLLARLYLENGDRERAHDEWGIALRLDADNFDANRGAGFVHLERGDFGTARRHLERAAAARPDDPAVQEALLVLAERLSDARGASTSAQPVARTPEPVEQRTAVAPQPSPAAASSPAPAPTTPAMPAVGMNVDPARLFDPLLRETPFLGAVLLDARGLILAGGLAQDAAGTGADALGAILSGAIEEAARTADLLQLGHWQGILLETELAQLHITSLPDDLMVLLAARAGAPAGWVVRTAARATELSRAFLAGNT